MQGLSERWCRNDCPVRLCAVDRAHDNCTECDDAGDCEHDNDIEHMRAGAIKAKMMVKTQTCPTHALIEDWKAQQRSRWPDALLLLP